MTDKIILKIRIYSQMQSKDAIILFKKGTYTSVICE